MDIEPPDVVAELSVMFIQIIAADKLTLCHEVENNTLDVGDVPLVTIALPWPVGWITHCV